VRVLVQALVAAPGGSVTVLRDLIAAWPNEDELLVVCWREEAATLLSDTGHTVVRIPSRSTPEALLRLRFAPTKEIRRFGSDVIWSQAVFAEGLRGPQAVHWRDIGSFVTIHPDTPRQRLKARREQRDLARADLRVFNSEAMRAAVLARYPSVEAFSSAVVHNGLDLAPILAGATALRTTRDDGVLRLLLPQGDAPHKRNPVAAEVLALLRADPPKGITDVMLTVPGAGNYTDLKEALAKARITDAARFPGYVSRAEMGELYAEADVVLMTGAAESFGNPIIEAHAAGRPVVTPPFAVAHELAGPLGFIADGGDAPPLAAEVRAVAELANEVSVERSKDARDFALRFTADSRACLLRDRLVGLRGLSQGQRSSES
jgi:glycosyltransferase involved in cell wall biosynthesis